MTWKEGLQPKRLCAGMLASVVLVGIYACSSPAPNTPQPIQPSQPAQAPVVYPITQPNVQPSTGTVPQLSTTQMTWEIRGKKYVDQDGNRQFSTQDKAVSGWDIRLYPQSAMQTNTWSTPLASTTTDANGNFAFSGLTSGNYLVVSAQQGNNGERLQQITPADMSYAKSVTLPQAANGYCQPMAYQVTVDNSCPQACDLSFIDQGVYPGLGYGAGAAYPYGAGAAYPYGAGGVYPYGAGGIYPYGAGCGGIYPYGAYTYPALIPILVVDAFINDDFCHDGFGDRGDRDDHDDNHDRWNR